MLLLGWIVLGLIIGIAGSRILNKGETVLAVDMAVGISGAILGGLLFNAVLQPSTLDPWNFSVAGLGSAAVLWVWHAFVRSA